MPAATLDLTVEQGATYSQTMLYQTSNGTAISLANCTLRMMARESINANTTVLSLSTTNGGIVITNAANGSFALAISAGDTANLSTGAYVYDLELVKPDTTVDRLLTGTLSVSGEVTR